MGVVSVSAAAKLTALLALVAIFATSLPAVGAEINATGSAAHRHLAATGGRGFWHTRGNTLYDATGTRIRFSGIGWLGLETPDRAPHGLWLRSVASMLDQMVGLGFNVIRLPFAGDVLKPGVYPANINYNANPDLQGLTCRQVIKKIVHAAGARGMRIILDYHRMRTTTQVEWGLWFDADHPESEWIANWASLAKEYRGVATVVGFDLFNEVHEYQSGAGYPAHPDPTWTWGTGRPNVDKYNWRLAVTRVANAIQAVNPDVLICVEGMWQNAWWGSNLTQYIKIPLRLKYPNKLLLSAHNYGPYVYNQSYFWEKNFPRNLPPLWDQTFGFVVRRNYAPLWIGEFGAELNHPGNTALDAVERKWFVTIVSYIKELGLSWTFWSWGPDSVDTGGILTGDWQTPDAAKLAVLRPIMHPKFV